jgi:hypothetical protein
MSIELKLAAKNPTEQRILAYLQENASEVLAEKINSGTKTLAGAMDYAKKEAQKLDHEGGCICVDDATVFGWIVHYFEEAHIEEKAKKPAFILPGSAVKKPAKAGKTAIEPSKVEEPPKVVPPVAKVIPKVYRLKKPAGPINTTPQLSMIEALLEVKP